MTQEAVQKINQQEIPKMDKNLRGMISFMTLVIIYLIVLIIYIIYTSWPILKSQIPLLLVLNIVVQLINLGLVILCRQAMVKGKKEALWFYMAFIGLNLSFNLIVRFFVTHEGFSALLLISLIIPSMVLITIFSLVKKGILV